MNFADAVGGIGSEGHYEFLVGIVVFVGFAFLAGNSDKIQFHGFVPFRLRRARDKEKACSIGDRKP